MNSCGNSSATVEPGMRGARLVWPAGMTTIMGLAFLAAIRLSRMKPARPTVDQELSESLAP